MPKSLGVLPVDWAELQAATAGHAKLKIVGGGKAVTLDLNRSAAGYLFSHLVKFLKREEADVAQMRSDLALENQA